MRKSLFLVATALSLSTGEAGAQVPLNNYTDANGYLDVQKLACGQLAGTFQEDADLLVAWYGGWYNGLAKKHLANPDRAKKLEHDIIAHCKPIPAYALLMRSPLSSTMRGCDLASRWRDDLEGRVTVHIAAEPICADPAKGPR